MSEEELVQADQHQRFRHQPRVFRLFGELQGRPGAAGGGWNVATDVPGEGKSLLDLTAKRGVVPGLGQGLREDLLGRGPAVLVVVDLAQALEQPRPLRARGHRAGGLFQQHASARGVAGQQVVAGRLHGPPAALARPPLRGQRARLLTEGSGRIRGAAEMRVRGRFLQRGRDPEVGALGGHGEVTGALFTVGDQPGQAAMQLAALAERGLGVQR
jgi:hypothetical protein